MGDRAYEPLVAFIVTIDKTGLGVLLGSCACFGVAATLFAGPRLAGWRARLWTFAVAFAIAMTVGSATMWAINRRLVVRLEIVDF